MDPNEQLAAYLTQSCTDDELESEVIRGLYKRCNVNKVRRIIVDEYPPKIADVGLRRLEMYERKDDV